MGAPDVGRRSVRESACLRASSLRGPKGWSWVLRERSGSGPDRQPRLSGDMGVHASTMKFHPNRTRTICSPYPGSRLPSLMKRVLCAGPGSDRALVIACKGMEVRQA